MKKYGDLYCSLEAYLEDALGSEIWMLLYGTSWNSKILNALPFCGISVKNWNGHGCNFGNFYTGEAVQDSFEYRYIASSIQTD